jgi:hypothetical protein
MALHQADIANFETLKCAAANGDLALMECVDAATGEYRAVICAVEFDGEEYQFVPIAEMAHTDPYTQWVPPAGGGTMTR